MEPWIVADPIEKPTQTTHLPPQKDDTRIKIKTTIEIAHPDKQAYQ